MTINPKLCISTIDFGSGGTERVISTLLPELVNDFEVTLVLFYNQIHYPIHKDVNLVILIPDRNGSTSTFTKLKDFVVLLFKYKSYIKHNHIDISLTLLPEPNIINSVVAMTNKKVKTIISERCYPSITYSNFSLKIAKVLFPFFYNKNYKLFSNSVHINEDLKDNFGVKLPMSVIYNPVEMDYNITKTTSEVAEKPFKIINVGSMVWRKNQKLIIEALHVLDKNDFHLTYLGVGHLLDDLKHQASQYELENSITYKGSVKNVKDYLVENDCFVLSSTTEGFPNVLIEALSVGLPSISTNCLSGPLELLNDNEPVVIENGDFYLAKYGILVNVDDSKGLANAIKYFKDHPEERKRYSQLGLQRAKDFDLKTIYAQVKELLLN
jgi:N-acetylgalactosamine-N,N'-diacetylbacillosaminyl-diphospho-undecaprenol 4-alpha-N-acetylgalactosaminyltransferase